MIERWKFERDLRFLDIGMDESLLDALYKYIQEMIFNEIEEAKISEGRDSDAADLEYENSLLQDDMESLEEKCDDLEVKLSAANDEIDDLHTELEILRREFEAAVKELEARM